MTSEQPKANETNDEEPKVGFHNFEEYKKEQLIALRDRIKGIKEAKSKIENISMWKDSAGTDDYKIVEQNERIIKVETPLILEAIDQRFALLEEEIRRNGEVKSDSGKAYQAEDVVSNIESLRKSSTLTKEELPLLIKKITRVNDYRAKVSELMNLLFDIKSI
jgi:hypothetical protein